MNPAPVIVSGFGPYEEVRVNPSGHVAFELSVRGPAGLPVVGGVLPASFQRAPACFDRLLDGAASPRALLPLGMHRGDTFRLERRAGGRFDVPDRPDVDGGVAADVGLAGEDLETSVDVEALAQVLREAGAPAVEVSTDAGAYVCERVYHHVLGLGRELSIPALFLHVPPPAVVPVERQVELVGALLAAWVR